MTDNPPTPTASVANATRLELKTHVARSNTTIHGWGPVLFGLPFVGVGIFVLMIAGKIINVDSSTVHAPMWVMGAVGLVFFLAGVLFIIHGLRGLWRRAKYRALKLRHGDQPWLADYAWDPSGIRSQSELQLGRNAIGLFIFTAFAAIAHGVAQAGAGLPFLIAAIIIDLVIVCIIIGLFYKMIRQFKYGNSYLRFESFPFVLGQTLNTSFENKRGIGTYEKITFTLRCIEEAYETRRSGKNTKHVVVLYQTYSDTFVIDQPGHHLAPGPPGPPGSPGSPGVLVTFALPLGNYQTQLAARPPRYWQLEIHASTPGVDFKSRFLLPVYAASKKS